MTPSRASNPELREIMRAFRPIISTVLISLSILFYAGEARASTASQSNLELYFASSLSGLHSHPIGFEGRNLDAAERKICRRRAIIREWLVIQEGAARLDELDEYFEWEVAQMNTAGARVSVKQEWSAIRFARKALKELESRKRAAEEVGIKAKPERSRDWSECYR